MVVAVSRFNVSASEADAIETRFKNRPRLADRHDGFLGLEILKTGGPEVSFMLIARWESRDKLKAYLRSQDFAEVHQGDDEGADFCLYEVVGH
ncbi:MAG: antibiotic biosynthesis monooxygenase [Candidatus Binataceae bacterium]|jgi:heme-degrading monooxygenase HmoA